MDNRLIHRVDIERPTIGQDTSGGDDPVFTTLVSQQPCTVLPMTSQYRLLYQERQIVTGYTVYFARPDIDITAGDRFKYRNKYLYILGIRQFDNGQVNLTAVDCEQQSGE